MSDLEQVAANAAQSDTRFPNRQRYVGNWLRLFKKSGRDRARVEAVDRSFM
jgi:hypothetical protein